MPFPISPTNNQIYNDGTYNYRYNSIFRSWTKIAQVTSNISSNTANVVTANGNVTTGNVTLSPANVTVGTTTVSNTSVTVGNTIIGNSNVTVGNTVIGNSNVTVGNTVIGNSNVTIGNTVIGNSNVTVGNTVITNTTITTSNVTANLTNGNTSIVPVANGNVAISVTGTPNVVVVSPTGANITGNVNVSSNITTANLSTSNLSVTSNANITGDLTITGNLTSGNANLGNLAKANFFQGDGSLLTNISVAAGSQILSGNSNVFVAANGNVTVGIAGNANVMTITGTGVNVSGTANITGNAVVGNLNTTGIVATTIQGNLTTSSQPNVTSLGTLTGLTVSGVSNLGPVSNVTITGGSANYFLMTNGSGALSWNNAAGVPAPGSNTQIIFNDNNNYNGDAGLTFNKSNGQLSVSGNIVTSNNISGNLLTGTLTTNAQPNVTSLGTLANLIVAGNINTSGNVIINSGSLNSNNANINSLSVTSGTLTSSKPLSITQTWNNSSVTFTAISASITDTNSGSSSLLIDLQVGGVTKFSVDKNGVITGNGSSLTGIDATSIQNGTANVRTFNNADVAISAAGNANIIVVTGTGANISGTANITGNANIGNIGTAQLLATANITAPQLISNISTGTAPLVVTSNTVVANLRAATSNVANTVSDNAQPNITSVGTLTSLAVTGNVTAGNVYANSGTVGANLLTGTLTTTAQPNVTSLGTLTSLSVTGNATAGNLIGPLANGNSNVTITANANITMYVAGNSTARWTATSTGVVANGTYSISGNANIGNIGTAQVLASANITSPQFISNATTGTAPLLVSSTTLVANLNADLLDGFSTATAATANTVVVRDTNGNITGNNISGTLATASQPNITSVGTLSSLSVTGNVSAGNVVGPLANGNSNVTITANANITMYVAGNSTARWTATSTGVVANGTYSISGNANIGNIGTAQVLATANITAPQLISNTSTGTSPLLVSSTTLVANLNADLLDGFNTATAATANTVVIRDANANITGNNISGSNITITSYQIHSVNTGISAAGSTQGTATVLTKEINVVPTVSSGQGVKLPNAIAGMRIVVMNTSANSLNVYPDTGAAINSAAANAAYPLGAGGRLDFISVSTTQWYTISATYA